MNPNRPTPRHIIIKIAKVKDKARILKAARKKQRVIYKGTTIKLSADFSAETLQARGRAVIYPKYSKGKICNLARLSFRIEGETKNSDKQKLNKSSSVLNLH